MRREHHADRRHHDVEAVIGERQRLRVGLCPFQLDPALGGDSAARVEKLGCEVARGDDRTSLGRRDGGVSGAGADIEDAVARLNPACADELGSKPGNQLGRDGRIVALSSRSTSAVVISFTPSSR